jgi:Tfp pilus assembly protein PilN
VRQQVNLYQPIFRKQKKKFSALAMLQSAAAIIAGVALLYAYTAWQVGLQREELTSTGQKLTALSKRAEDVTQRFGAEKKGESIDARIARLEGQLAARHEVQRVLQRGVFSNTEGFSPYLIAFSRQHFPGIWLTEFEITGAADQLTLQGRTSNPEFVPRYVRKLSAEKKLNGIEFQIFQIARPGSDGKSSKAPYVDFKLTTAAAARQP